MPCRAVRKKFAKPAHASKCPTPVARCRAGRTRQQETSVKAARAHAAAHTPAPHGPLRMARPFGASHAIGHAGSCPLHCTSCPLLSFFFLFVCLFVCLVLFFFFRLASARAGARRPCRGPELPGSPQHAFTPARSTHAPRHACRLWTLAAGVVVGGMFCVMAMSGGIAARLLVPT